VQAHLLFRDTFKRKVERIDSSLNELTVILVGGSRVDLVPAFGQ
jgi:hypothetical protein